MKADKFLFHVVRILSPRLIYLRIMHLFMNPKFKVTFYLKNGQKMVVKNFVEFNIYESADTEGFNKMEWKRVDSSNGFSVPVDQIAAITYKVHGWTFANPRD